MEFENNFWTSAGAGAWSDHSSDIEFPEIIVESSSAQGNQSSIITLGSSRSENPNPADAEPENDRGMNSCVFFSFYLSRVVNAGTLYLPAEVNKQSRANKVVVAYIVGGTLVAHVAIIGGVLRDQQLHLGLVYVCPNVNLQSGWALLWVVTMLDFTAKAITIIAKGILVILPQVGSLSSMQSRGKYYLLIEVVSQLYRYCLPITPWAYFLVGSSWPDSLSGIALAIVRLAIYSYFKVPQLWEFCKVWKPRIDETTFSKESTTELIRQGNKWKTRIRSAQICLNNFKHPTRLLCSHIFCSECIHTMFVMTQTQTCPICRAVILPYKPICWDGTTSNIIQIL